MTRPLPVGPDGIWYEVRHRRQGRRALLLDRDGVIIHDRGYLSDPAGVDLIGGIVALMADAREAGCPVAVVTNQSGIARGYFEWEDFARVQDRMIELLGTAGVEPDLVVACPHHPSGRAPFRRSDPPMRKPNPGMLNAALSTFAAEPEGSLMIGDKVDDMRAAARARVGLGILVGATASVPGHTVEGMPVHAVADVRSAVPLVRTWLADTTARDQDCDRRGARRHGGERI